LCCRIGGLPSCLLRLFLPRKPQKLLLFRDL